MLSLQSLAQPLCCAAVHRMLHVNRLLAAHQLCLWLKGAGQLVNFVCCMAGVAGYGTQICMTYALKYSKAAPALAMSYLSVVWGLLGGFFFFHEVTFLSPLNQNQ